MHPLGPLGHQKDLLIMNVAVVVTTINLEAPAIPVLSQKCEALGWELIIVGDKKTRGAPPKHCMYLDTVAQEKLPYRLAQMLPWNDYVRKNLGYIVAWHEGADYIISTDDDNIPMDNWETMPKFCTTNYSEGLYPDEGKFVNFLPEFSRLYRGGIIWPRGLPFESVVRGYPARRIYTMSSDNKIGVVAGLWNGSPDFDAIGHSMHDSHKWIFEENIVRCIKKGFFAPYNTQNTLFTRELLPFQLLAHGIGRANDIWTSYISQFIMSKLGYSVAFISPTVYQRRNQHSFCQDFQDEFLCYTKTTALVDALEKVESNEDPVLYYLDLCFVADQFICTDNSFYNEVVCWLKDLGVY